MVKKAFTLSVIVAVLLLLGFGLAVRKLPGWVVHNLRQTLGREVSVESVRLDFPLKVRMSRLLIAENAPFKGEPAVYVENAEATVDLLALVTSKKLVFLNMELTRPRIIFRKLSGKVYNAFRLRPDQQFGIDAAAPADAAVSPLPLPIEFRRITIRDGEIQFMDYDVDRDGFVVTLLRLTAEITDLTLLSDDRRTTFEIESFLDQGRDAVPAHLTLSGDWTRKTMDGKSSFKILGLSLPYFKPYYEFVTPSQISDGELDLIATTDCRDGDLTANSKWSLRRLTFAQTESGNELLGFDANIIKNILTGGSGNISLDLVLQMNLRDRSVPFGTILRKSLIQSVKANFQSHFNTVLQNTVSQLTDKNSDLLKNQNWKDLIKKNNLDEVIEKVMSPE